MEAESNQLKVLDCRGCGVCCLHMGYPAFNLSLELLQKMEEVPPGDLVELGPAAAADWVRWRAMPSELRASLLQRMVAYSPPQEGELDSACIWLDLETRQCVNHEYRPQVCRDFETGSSACLEWRGHYREKIQ